MPVDALAACLSLEPADIRTDHHEPHVVSVGAPFLVAEVKSRDALRRAKANLSAFAAMLPSRGADAIYFYTRDRAANESSCDFTARMFAPSDGIIEDPATGSATAAVAALLAEKSPERDGELKMRFMQGVDMGRPSTLNARVHKRGGRLETVRVGGRCVQVMEGSFDLKDT
jgi:trans-2,3-dihydro-3-hydroxyanthranilate isomerase